MLHRIVSHPARALALVLALGAAVAVTLAGPGKADDPVARRAKVHLMDRQFVEAAELLAKEPGNAEQAAERRFLRAHALLLAGDFTGSARALEEFVRDFPNAPEATRARLTLAAAKRGAKDFEAAAAIDRAQLRTLLSPERRNDLSKVYVDYADKAEKGLQPDWARARTFLDLAVGLELPPADDERLRSRAAEMAEKVGDFKDALQRLRSLRADRGDGAEGSTRFRIAQLERLTGDPRGARRSYEDFLRDYPKSERASEAAYGIALTHGMPSPPNDESLARGVASLKRVIEGWPGSKEARSAAFDIALGELHRRRFDDAVRDFRAFVASSPKPAPSADADRDDRVAVARARIGDALYAQSRYSDAIVAWRLYLAEHPSHGEFGRVHRAIVDAEFAIARTAAVEALESEERARERGDQAREAVQGFLASHPLDARQAATALWLGRIEETRQRFDVARDEYERVASKFAGAAEASEAQFHVGRIFEERTFDYEKAIAAYKAVTGAWQERARQRIAELQRKQLEVVTKRTTRTDESPSIEITSRNIEKVRVRIFRLDLETFFRAKLAEPRIEPLDVEVIEPDWNREVGTENYRAHESTTRTLALAECGGKPGAYVVKVDDGELEATTLVLVSDLVLVTKASRRDALVFAQDAKTGDPLSGVRVVVSDGSKILFEENTGADGVLLRRDDALAGVGALVVYGSSAAGAAVSGLDLSSLGRSAVLAPKCFVVLDRSSYRPGDLVRAWVVTRGVKDGGYVVEEGRRVRLAMQDASGTAIRSADVSLGAFGTAASDLAIPASAGFGSWTVAVVDDAKKETLGAASFAVEDVRRERIRCEVKLARSVVMRGETVEGTVQAQYFSGGPVGKRSVTLEIADVDPITVTTDSDGSASFSFATRDLAEEGTYAVVARLADEAVFGLAELVVTTVEFRPRLTTLQQVVLAGEGFDVSLETKDAADRPAGAELRLSALRREERGLRKVEERTVVTDPKTGKAVARLSLAEGGTYVLRAEGADRFGTAVAADHEIEVSGDDDAVKLRLFVERDSWRLGERIVARVVSRMAGERSCLVVREGAGVLGYRIVRVPRGESPLDLEVDEALAPQFTLALAAVDDWTLHTAAKTFSVSQELTVEVKPAAASYGPGEEASVDVVVRDARGKPVAAEVALAVVDEAFLAVRPDATPSLRDFFFSATRDAGTVTASSCGFYYDAETRSVASDLAAEEERMRLREETASPPEASPVGDVFLALDSVLQAGELDEKSKDALRSLGYAGGGGAPAGLVVPGAPPMPNAEPSNGSDWGNEDEARAQTGTFGAVGGDSLARKSADKRVRFSARRGGALAKNEAGGRYKGPGDTAAAFEAFAGNRLDLDLPNESADASGAQLRSLFSETAALARVVSDASGAGRTTFRLPDSTTSWNVKARGVTRATELGEGSASFLARRDLEVSLRLPGAFAEGDRVESAGLVRNASSVERTVEARLTATGATGEAKLDASLAAGAEEALVGDLTISGADEVRLALSARAGDDQDRIERTVGVRAAGSAVADFESALVRDQAILELELPAFETLRRPSLSIVIGPSLEAAVLEDPAPTRRHLAGGMLLTDAPGWTVTFGAVALERLQFLGRVGGADAAQAATLRRRVVDAVARLVAEQAPDGSFGWTGTLNVGVDKDQKIRATPDIATTARALAFLGRARTAAIAVPDASIDRATTWVRARLRQNDGAVDRARMLLALAETGQGDLELLNRLQRAKASVPDTGLALLALCDLRMGRRDLAAEVAVDLRERLRRVTAGPGAPKLAADDLEAQSLALAALADIDARDAMLAALSDRIRTSRTRARSDRAEEAAVAALARYHGAAKPEAAEYELDVVLNGNPIRTVRSAEARSPIVLEVAGDAMRGKNRIDVRLRGRGEVSVDATMSATMPVFDSSARERFASVRRSIEPSELRYRGKPIPRGFDVVDGPYKAFTNTVKNLVSGTEALVSVTFLSREKDNSPLEYAILEEPIPAGCEVVPDSIRGDFERALVRGGAIVAAWGPAARSGRLSYRLLGVRPGEFLHAPATLAPAYRPDRTAEGDVARLVVLGAGTKSPDEIRLTPDELYHGGIARYDAGERSEGAAWLRSAVSEWRLADAPLREATRRILLDAVARNDSEAAITSFEQLRDRFPDVVLPFEIVTQVGDAYLAARQAEVADLIYRGTMGALFRREANVAGALLREREFLAAVRFLEDLHRVYPDAPETLTALHHLAGLVAAGASSGAGIRDVDGTVVSRDALLARAGEIEMEFLVRAPNDPLAPEASFGLLSTELERGHFSGVVEGCAAFGRRYPESSFLDKVLYLEGYSRFANGEPAKALEILARVVAEQFPDGRGGRSASSQRDRAVFLRAQILHATGDAASAVAEYEKVQGLFTDAADALQSFRRKELSLPEVRTVTDADLQKDGALPASPTLDLVVESRNLARAQMRVYRVDLMRLYLMERNLDRMTDIDLAGIAPLFVQDLTLGPGEDFTRRKSPVQLPLAERGAYLVVLRAEGEKGSAPVADATLVLRTDLQLEVREDAAAGRVWVNVRDARGASVPRADVRVVGSDGEVVRVGATDLRGVFSTDAIEGRATVVARAGEGAPGGPSFAFHRGTVSLEPKPSASKAVDRAASQQADFEFQNTQEFRDANDQVMRRNIQQLEQLLNKQQQGVELQRVR